MSILKQAIGVDVSKDTLVVAIGTIDHTQQINCAATASFANTSAGMRSLIAWSKKHRHADHSIPLWVVMEATGVYHEKLAVRLHDDGWLVSIVLASNIKHFIISHNSKSKTDRIDAAMIMRFALERAVEAWKPAEALYSELRSLVREHDSLQDVLNEIGNRLHAIQHRAASAKPTIKRLRAEREFLKKHLKQIEAEIKELVKSEQTLSESVALISSIPGVGLMTAVAVLGETNNFEHIESASQLVSYAGLDPVHHQSGTHAGKTHISSKGNRRLRKRLYMPSLSAIRFNAPLRGVYQRLVAAKGVRKIAVAAVMRKLLSLIYTLWKKRQRFDAAFGCNALFATPDVG